jgi:4-methyl-5(b-hydroxyethyl)-thiazole monophosphate biosynthesis
MVDGFEEIEAVAPIDLLRRAGAEVILASLSGETHVTGRCQVRLQTDQALGEADAAAFDLLLIPGGPGVAALRRDGRAVRLAQAMAHSGKPVAAICAAPTVLLDAGVLAGRRHTAHYSVVTELPQALLEERVVEDGLLITSRGAGTAIDFGLALVKRLYGEAKAQEIARAIMS